MEGDGRGLRGDVGGGGVMGAGGGGMVGVEGDVKGGGGWKG